MHSFIRSYFLTIAILALGTSAVAEDSAVLSTKEVTQLRIVRQSFADSLEQDKATFVQNELQLQVFLSAMSGHHPSVAKDRVLPAAEGAAVAGSVRYAMTLKLLQPAMEWLVRVAPTATKVVVKKVPYVGGAAFAVYELADFNRYQAAVEKVNAMKAENPQALATLRQAEYERMLTLRDQLTQNIACKRSSFSWYILSWSVGDAFLYFS